MAFNRPHRVVEAVAALAAILVLPGACQSLSGNFCAAATPIFATPEDRAVISDALVQQLNVHNETGQALCGWTP